MACSGPASWQRFLDRLALGRVHWLTFWPVTGTGFAANPNLHTILTDLYTDQHDFFSAPVRCGDARGSIMVNSRPRDMTSFRKMCRYIMQEDLLQPSLTVMESMKISADLKLGQTIADDVKLDSVLIPLYHILPLRSHAMTAVSCCCFLDRRHSSYAPTLQGEEHANGKPIRRGTEKIVHRPGTC